MHSYEALYIISPDFDEQATKDLVEKFSGVVTTNGGTVDKCDEWGRRRLAYPIDYKTEGYYVLSTFQAPPELPSELERIFKITDGILRYMVIRLDA